MARPRRIVPQPRRVRRAVLAVLAIAFAACGSRDVADAGVRADEAPTIRDAWARPVAEIGPMVESLAQRAGSRPADRAAVDLRHASALARVLALRDPTTDWVGRAREWSTRAATLPTPSSCAAWIDLAQLEARDRGSLDDALRAARSASEQTTDVECARRARLLVDRLSVLVEPVPSSAQATAVLTALTVYGQGADGAASVRVVLRFDREVAYEHGEAAATAELPRRTWFELPRVTIGEGIGPLLTVDAAGLLRVRTVGDDAGARVTLDLAPDARFHVFVLPEPYRVVIDVGRAAAAQTERALRTLVLDPGHGGDEFGARAFGLRESDLTLDLARRVRALLTRRLPDVRVVLTRETDRMVSLEERAAFANAIDADLFLSLHLNAADEPVEHGGVTTFVLDTSNDRQALRLAARENGTTTEQVGELAHLLAGLHREEQVRASRAFAEQVHRATLAGGRRVLPRLYDRGVRSAMFYVLVGARMPAILLEASFMSREDEAAALRTTAYRQALAEGIADGIARYAGR